MTQQTTVPDTFHSYSACCSKGVFKQYAYLEYCTLEHPELLERHIYTFGFELPEGIRTDDGKVYHHIFTVLSRDDIAAELPVLFPKVTDAWTHRIERTEEEPQGEI